MVIWVDADSCPLAVRKTVQKISVKRRILSKFVGNTPLPLTASPYIQMICVPPGDQEADRYITEYSAAADLVITRDLPLTESLVKKEVAVINDQGKFYNRENIKEKISVRNFMYSLREERREDFLRGKLYKKKGERGRRDQQLFANALDRFLSGAGKKKDSSLSF